MMRNALICIVISLAIHFAFSDDSTCHHKVATSRFLQNIDKMLNQNKVKLVDGISLKRKFESTEISNASCPNDTMSRDWLHELRERFDKIMKTHVLKFDLASVIKKDVTSGETGRRRHRQQQAISMMLMGITVFLMFFVPMGFQFLAALGGKAFLMAKLALLLASVNGLKRVASSGVHYGLYQTSPELSGGFPQPHYGYERFDRPRQSS